ncbi:MAG: flagellar basal body P-ring protein FlgI, partial [Alphaproteobacteria bacterium]|nr:flagellar basal body P-ring protein FlgI [Alphaproteobacteria bacterium]
DSPGFPGTGQSLRGMLQRQGVASPDQTIRSRGAAMVTVSAALPAFAQPGTRIDVAIGVLGDATSLQGGVLQPTPLVGPDGEVYAVAQGPVSIGGFSAAGSAASVTQGVVATAHITGGAVVERAPKFDLNRQATVTVSLLNPDFSLARQVARAINAGLNADVARMQDNTNIDVTVPPSYSGRAAELVADIESLPVQPSQSAGAARVVIDDRTGTIVFGDQVRLSTVAISHGSLTVRVTEAPLVSQPPPFSPGRTVVVPRSTVEVSEGGSGRVVVLPAGSTIGDLVNSLNALQLGVRDQIEILQAMKQAGAIQGDLVTAH